jgi:excisionase family DNA binding protein
LDSNNKEVGLMQMLTAREAALKKGCTRKYIYDLLAVGRLLGAKKVGRVWRIPAAFTTSPRKPAATAE